MINLDFTLFEIDKLIVLAPFEVFRSVQFLSQACRNCLLKIIES